MDPLGALIDWVALYGVLGLIAVGVAERFVPILPSYGVLVAIGIAAAGGMWSIPAALAATVVGNLAGCLLLYAVALALGEVRATRLLGWIGHLAGMSAARVDSMASSFHSRQRLLAFGAQLVPGVRLISPVIAGVFRADAKVFTIATMAGIVVWNGLFISVGHVAGGMVPSANASAVAIKILIVLVVTEATLGLAWRWRSRRATRAARGRSR